MRIDVHAHYYPPELVDAYSFMIGACFEDTITSIRLVMSGITARYPQHSDHRAAPRWHPALLDAANRGPHPSHSLQRTAAPRR